MIQLRWEDRRARAALAAVASAMDGPSLAGVIKATMTPRVRTVTEARFGTEGDSATGQWRPLSSATARIRENMGYSGFHPINIRTGALKRYVTQSSFNTTAVTPNAAVLRYPSMNASGELLNKMIVAQGGGQSLRGQPIPARPVLSFVAEDAAFLLASMQSHLMAVMRAA